MKTKNKYSLTRRNSKRGYDWWWHSFVGTHAESGALKPFFIEYYVINPGLWKEKKAQLAGCEYGDY